MPKAVHRSGCGRPCCWLKSGADCCAECSRRLVHDDGSTTCYSLVFAGDTWSVARRQCASRGPSSRLVVVSSAEQNAAVTALLQDNGLAESWLAASERRHAWQWLDGQ